MTSIEALRRKQTHVAVVGLGYVGIPLVAAMSRHYSVYGLDRDPRRVRDLRAGVDPTCSAHGAAIAHLGDRFTTDAGVLTRCGFIIVTVPTPIAADHTPDLELLQDAARAIGGNLSPGSVVVLESTVYPGVTEEVFGPIIAAESGLDAGIGFHLGYSPERINPGDEEHTVELMVKVVAGESPRVTELMCSVYGAVTGGSVHRSASIRIAEAAKVFENTQRDLNIALMNELAMICHRLDVDTGEVIRTASTKWNFAHFEPGLVGGHCIGVDPYYLTHAAERVGHLPHLILAGRQVNDAMGRYVATRTAALLRAQHDDLSDTNVLVLGFTFKEDVADTRNTRVADLVHTLCEHRMTCSIYDPLADRNAVREQYGLQLLADAAAEAPYHAVIVAVKHERFRSQFPLTGLQSLVVNAGAVLVDVKSLYGRAAAEAAGFTYWRL